MKYLKSLASILLFNISFTTNANLLVGYIPDVISDVNITASAIATGPGLNRYDEYATCAILPEGCNRVDPGNGSSTAALAIANNDYIEFTLSANSGYLFNLSSFNFLARKGGDADPRGWVLRSSADLFSNDIDSQLVTTTSSSPAANSFSVSLMDAQFQNLSDISFRLYTFSPRLGLIINYSELAFLGTTMAVHEVSAPPSFGLFALVLLYVLARRKKQVQH